MTCILVLTLSYYINYVTSSVQVPHLPKFPDVPSFSKEGRGGSSSHDQDSYWNNIWNNKKVTTGDPPFYENVMKTTLFLSQNSSLHHPSFCWFSLCDLWIKICFTTHQLQPHPHDNPMITPLFQSPPKKRRPHRWSSDLQSAPPPPETPPPCCWTINGNHHETGRCFTSP